MTLLNHFLHFHNNLFPRLLSSFLCLLFNHFSVFTHLTSPPSPTSSCVHFPPTFLQRAASSSSSSSCRLITSTISSPCLSNLCVSSHLAHLSSAFFSRFSAASSFLCFSSNSRISSPSLSNLRLSSYFLDLSSINFSDAVSLFLFWLSLLSLPASILSFFRLLSLLFPAVPLSSLPSTSNSIPPFSFSCEK